MKVFAHPNQQPTKRKRTEAKAHVTMNRIGSELLEERKKAATHARPHHGIREMNAYREPCLNASRIALWILSGSALMWFNELRLELELDEAEAIAAASSPDIAPERTRSLI